MAGLETSFGQSESPDIPIADGEKSSFFQDPYTQSNVSREENGSIMITDLTSLMRSVHELNSHAKEHFDDKEYAEALTYLLESYRRLTEFRYSPHSDEVTPMVEYMYWLAWVCYRIAFCYVEAGDYVSAYYYIDLVSAVNASCFMEWINILVNSRRMDALGVVETYVEDSEMLNSICDDESEKKTVMDFLERRLGYLYIEYGELEKALELFTRLLDNPGSCDFAREELEYIDNLK